MSYKAHKIVLGIWKPLKLTRIPISWRLGNDNANQSQRIAKSMICANGRPKFAGEGIAGGNLDTLMSM